MRAEPLLYITSPALSCFKLLYIDLLVQKDSGSPLLVSGRNKQTDRNKPRQQDGFRQAGREELGQVGIHSE